MPMHGVVWFQGDDILLLAFCFCMTFDVFKEVFPIKALLAVKVYDEALCDSDELDLLFHGPIGVAITI